MVPEVTVLIVHCRRNLEINLVEWSTTYLVLQNNENVAIPTRTKRPRLQVASQASHSRQTTLALDSIVEEDESQVDTLVADSDVTGFPEYDRARVVGESRFIDALAGSDNDEGGSGDSDTGMYSEEEVDIKVSSDSGSEDEDDGLSSLSQPVKRRCPSHSHNMKTQSHGSSKPRHTKHKPNMEDSYDPSTCRKWPN